MPKTTRLSRLALVLPLVTAATAAHAAAEGDDSLFVLDRNQSFQNIAYEDNRQFRICVDAETVNRSLKVSHETTASTVKPGTCYTFEGSKFRVSAPGIHRDEVITGRVETLD